MILRKWWGSRADSTESSSARKPPDARIYAIGDIHGRAELLAQMHEAVRVDLQRRPCATSIEVYIGDYIDRGPSSYEVVEVLSASPPLCDQRVCLMGNHERILLDFLDDPLVLSSWISLGGLETLRSYGVRIGLNPPPREFTTIQGELQFHLPQPHKKFFQDLPLSFSFGNYFFVHAGVRPGVALDKQDAEDLLWIRDSFLNSAKDFGAVVVHGHTPGHVPIVLPNRICIDTGAYATGMLTCMVIEGNERRFMTATRQGTIAPMADRTLSR